MPQSSVLYGHIHHKTSFLFWVMQQSHISYFNTSMIYITLFCDTSKNMNKHVTSRASFTLLLISG